MNEPFPHALMNEPLPLDTLGVEEWFDRRADVMKGKLLAGMPSTPIGSCGPEVASCLSADLCGRGKKRSRLEAPSVGLPRRRRAVLPEQWRLVLEYCSGRALGALARCSRSSGAEAAAQAGRSLERLTTLRLGAPGVADWGSDARLLSVFTEPPDLLALFVTRNPVGCHAVPRVGLLRTLSRGRTDYARPDHRAFAMKCALRFGDAALIEGVALRMTDAEILRNELPPRDALPPSARPYYDAWFTSYTDADEFARRFAKCRLLKTAHVRAKKRPEPIPLELCPTIAESWRDAVDRSVRKRFSSSNDVSSDDPVPSWVSGSEILLHFVRLDVARAAGVPTPGRRYFPGLADPERLATFVRRALENDDGDALHALFDVGAPPRWPPPPPPAPLDWDDDDELDSDDEAHFRLHQWLAQIPVH